MPSPTEITVAQLSRLVGTAECPIILDTRLDEDFALDPRLIPRTQRHDYRHAPAWAETYRGRRVVVACQRGLKLSQGTAAWLRHAGADAVSLEGGFEAWRQAGGLLIDPARITRRDPAGRSLWVTKARPKVDRMACPWLIRRFVDPDAVFLFVAPTEVLAVAERFGAEPFDVDGVFWTHRGDPTTPEHLCSFDTMVLEFGFDSAEALRHLARIIRGADTARPELAPEAAGVLAMSLGLSRMFRDDLAQLEAGMMLYDALYRWCRDAVEETHDWPHPGRRG